jgi:PIN domain nuclease of toxin-antitoxin system
MKIRPASRILAWFADDAPQLTGEMRDILEDGDNQLFFNAASLWELAIKRSLRKADFNIDPRLLRRALLENAFEKLPVSSAHALAVEHLEPIHRDPFDRILIAQALVEGLLLLTSDETVAR